MAASSRYDDLFDSVEQDERKKFPPLWPTAADDWLAEPPGWLIEALIAEDSNALIYGPSGSLKSFVTLAILYALATGKPMLGQPVTPQHVGPVFYFCGEGYQAMRTKRRAAWEMHHGYDVEKGFLPDAIRFTKQLPYVTDQELIDNLIKEAKAILGDRKAGGFAIDTMSRTLNGQDEDRAGVIARYLNIASSIREELGAPMSLTVHHPGKDPERGARGSYNIIGGFDTRLRTIHHEDPLTHQHTIGICIEKQKDDETGQRIYAQSVLIPTRWGNSLALDVIDAETAEAVLPAAGAAIGSNGDDTKTKQRGLSEREVTDAIRAIKPHGGVCTTTELKTMINKQTGRNPNTVRVTLTTNRTNIGDRFTKFWLEERGGWAIPGMHLEGCGESLQAQLDSLNSIDALRH